MSNSIEVSHNFVRSALNYRFNETHLAGLPAIRLFPIYVDWLLCQEFIESELFDIVDNFCMGNFKVRANEDDEQWNKICQESSIVFDDNYALLI